MLQLRQEPAFGKKSKNSAKSKGQKDTHIILKKPAGHKTPVFQDFTSILPMLCKQQVTLRIL
jgi:hypothetical protein